MGILVQHDRRFLGGDVVTDQGRLSLYDKQASTLVSTLITKRNTISTTASGSRTAMVIC